MAAYSKFVYAPRPGDEVKWPNGLVMSYDDATELIHVSGVPEDDVLSLSSSAAARLAGREAGWTIGVTE